MLLQVNIRQVRIFLQKHHRHSDHSRYLINKCVLSRHLTIHYKRNILPTDHVLSILMIEAIAAKEKRENHNYPQTRDQYWALREAPPKWSSTYPLWASRVWSLSAASLRPRGTLLRTIWDQWWLLRGRLPPLRGLGVLASPYLLLPLLRLLLSWPTLLHPGC